MAERSVPQRHSSSSSTIRASRERPRSSHSTTSDVFSDDFELDESSVADGFRPPNTPSNSNNPPSLTRPIPPPRRTSQLRSSIDQARDKPRQVDGQNIHTRPNSFTLRHDGRSLRIPRRAPSAASTIDATDTQTNRPISSISNFSFPRRQQSPYQGAMGPSHPYAMYPQDISVRPSSVATTVHVPERSLSGPNRPTHPYGMYPQNALIESDVSPETSPGLHFPVGFPGLGQQYQRRLGPDGEDADDIIGPDGHTEQLPPYTRYPHSTPRKLRTTPSIRSLPPEAEPGLPSPENESSQTLIDNDVRALALDQDETVAEPSPTHQANPVAPTTADELGQSESSKEKWARKSKKRLFGRLPYWAAILIMVLLIILAATLGGVIGGAVSNHKHTKHSGGHFTPSPAMASATVYATVTTTLIDATPLASIPVNLPPLPQGQYGVLLGGPTTAQTSCLTTPGQQNAWACTDRAYLDLNVIYADYAPTQVTLTSGMLPGAPLRYGAQPPFLKSQTGISLMIDVDDVDRGPAYFFQQPYDKLVILPELAFSNGSYSKRWLDEHSELEERAQSIVEERDSDFFYPQPGDRPWFCFWNNTLLEGFIYVTENTTYANFSATATGSPLSSSMLPTLAGSSASTSSCPSTSITSFASSTSLLALSASPTTQSANVPGVSSAVSHYSSTSTFFSSSLLSATDNPSAPMSTYQASQTTDYDKLRRRQSYPSNIPKLYPKVIKIEERRTSQNMVHPYCQQMVVLDDMSLGVATNGSGDLVIVQLAEDEPATQHRVVASVTPSGNMEENGEGKWRDKDGKDKGDWMREGRREGKWQKQNGGDGDRQTSAREDVAHDRRMGNVDKREALIERLIRDLIGRGKHETRDADDDDDDDGCRYVLDKASTDPMADFEDKLRDEEYSQGCMKQP